jgi:putative ABC transport system substrate-binding protein
MLPREEGMRRRDLLTLLSGAAALPFMARAQQPPIPVVGVLRTDMPATGTNVIAAFRKGLSEMGFVEGRNVTIELRWAQNDRTRCPDWRPI